MSSHHQTSRGSDSSHQDAHVLSGVIAGYIGNDTSLINSIISEHGSTRYGSKKLADICASVDKTLEKGTALITAQSIDEGFPGLLLYPDGLFEAMSPPMQQAYVSQHKPVIFLHRTLQSLDGTPTKLSEPDLTVIEDMVMTSKKADEIGSNVSFGAYDKVLHQLTIARLVEEMGKMEGEDENSGVYKIDLNSVPFSIQSRKSGWNVNADPGNELASWAWEQVTKIHGEDPSVKTVVLELKDLDSPLLFSDFSENWKNRLTKRVHRTAEAAQSLFEIENFCSLDSTPAARHSNLVEFTPHSDDFSRRFQRTVRSTPARQNWLYDTFLASATRIRELSELETQALIPRKLLKQFSRATDQKLLHSAYRRGISRRPSAYIRADDQGFARWQEELVTALEEEQEPPLRWKNVPREGHESLLKHVGSVLEGNGPQAFKQRYGAEHDETGHPATVAEDYDDADPLRYFLMRSHKNSTLTPEALEEEMPPAAFRQWSWLKASNVGKNISEYQQYLEERLISEPDYRPAPRWTASED
ncbi:hypothetical protein IAR50_006894 [Cryptococcus sp. DSM 104548]